MAQYKTPGVYVEETSKLAPSVAGVATAIPAFIGYTGKTVQGPVRITSLLDYEEQFATGPALKVSSEGNIVGKEFVMYDSVRMFYANGGGVCYVVSIGIYPTGDNKPDFNAYTAGIDSLKETDEVTLVLCPDAALALSGADLNTVYNKMITHCAEMKDRFALLDVVEPGTFRSGIGINGLCYGAAYYPMLKSVYKADFSFLDVITYMKAKQYAVSEDAFTLAENKGKPARKEDGKEIPAVPKYNDEELAFRIKNMKATIAGYDAALEALQDEASVITPSGAVAGAIVATDNNVGVWQAPANVSLTAVKSLTKNITSADQDDLNVDTTAGKSINAIRKFSGKGILIWGARTLDGNDNEWRYIPVRRLFNYIEESIQKSTSWAVFQPNDENTWVKVKCQISNFLTGLWRSGALAGSTPEAAFYVNVGRGITMTDDEINNGYLNVEVGIAAVRPAEFIVLKFSHLVQQ